MLDPNSKINVNTRFSARGAYYRWLVQQYGSIPMLELQEDNQDPISLRKIFIPLRLDVEDRDESSINPPAKFHEESKDNQLGQDAFEEIVQYDFLVISGRPGAGKTTLIKALINELCGTHTSNFRSKMHERCGALFTIPMILRELPEIESADSFDDLLNQWWQRLDELNNLAYDRKTFAERLDIKSLRASLEHDDLQPLILFDGIDEVGSFDLRRKIYKFAQDANNQGYRAIVTGRPSGLADLHTALKSGELSRAGYKLELKRAIDDLSSHEALELKNTTSILDAENESELKSSIEFLSTTQESPRIFKSSISEEQWRFIQPLTRPQIDLFIKKWYQLDPTWVSKLGTHPEEFKAALADPQRDHLLPLARRPIFLSLMAIVHCTKNEMPHGRAELYKTIVDVYLTRQRKHRRLKQTTTGESMPQWDSHEPRTALGYLAWRSMQKGEGEKDKNARRILWKREDIEAELEDALKSTLRFSEVTPDDATSLINYYLDPAGLLIEPMEGYIQFAHLSFQEYLCAEYLQGQMSGRRIKRQWEEQVLNHLESPSWQEVALLLLTVHANKTQNRGHFELISFLDISNYQQAQLMFCALLGKELPVQAEDRQHWFSLLIMAALVHPKMSEIKYFREWSDLNNIGLECLLKMLGGFYESEGEGVWRYISTLKVVSSSSNWEYEYFDDFEEHISNALERWASLSNDDVQDAQQFSLLNLLTQSQWGGFDSDDQEQPLKNSDLQAALSKIYQKRSLWIYDDTKWKLLSSHYFFESCFNRGGTFETIIREGLPLNLWLLVSEKSPLMKLPSVQSAIISDKVVNEKRTILSLAFLQWQLFLETFSIGLHTREHLQKLEISKSALPSVSSLDMSRLSRREFSEPRLLYRSNLRAAASLQTTMMSMASTFRGRIPLSIFTDAITSMVGGKRESPATWYENNVSIFQRLMKSIEAEASNDEELALLGQFVTFTANNFAAYDWFFQQSEEPKLLINRGGRVNEPLPSTLDLFTEKGIPYEIQSRDKMVALKEWVADDENWLSFVFSETKLDAETRQMLLDDISELKRCDWSPYHLMDAVMADWPENEKTKDCSMKESERKMVKAFEEFFEKYPEK